MREQKAEEKKSKSAALKAGKAGKGGGDLMSDLANKLAMRRKGISGWSLAPNFSFFNFYDKMLISMPLKLRVL